MRRIVNSFLACVFLFLTSRAIAAPADDLVAKVAAILPESPGACVLAIDHGQVVFEHAYGQAELETKTPATPQTNYRIASVSKQFTAAAIMLLVERGQLSVDDPVTKFFPGFPTWGEKITVENLLVHNSGLPDYENLIPTGTTLQLDDLDVLQLLMDAKEPLFAPGEKWQYSNSGYTLLGLIVEQVAKKPFHEFVADEIFKPLDMNDSLIFVRGLNQIPNRAFGYEKQAGQWVRADQSLTSAVRGDGGVYTSLVDYRKWLAALDARKLFKPATYDAIFTPHVVTWRDSDYGYGWFIDKHKGERRIFHNGDTHCFSGCVQRFPDRQAAVVLHLNSLYTGDMTELGTRLADALIFDRPE